jgi:hypothetical protein
MDKENVTCLDAHNGVQFSHEVEQNTAIFSNIQGSGRYCIK